MGKIFDVIVVGLGAMGSAVAYHLARRKYRVLGLDRFCPPHALGSSHGQSRIIREAYFEDPVYVPLVRRAYELWRELEGGTGRRLLRQTGGLMIGPADGVLVAGARRSAETHGLAHEVMAAAEVRRRFPALRVPDEMTAVWEPRAGVLAPELGIWAHLDLARQFGAALQWEETVLSWNTSENDVRVVTNQGEYEAGRLILSAGPWIVTLARDLAAEFRVERQVQFWFEPNGTPSFAPEVCPVHLWEHAPNRFFYGFPDLGAGVKVAGHHEGADTTVEDVNRSVSPEEVA
ncbi:MAG TPA: N-methyl-L-tryptophan oxidase, partial [Methylomirabilota bacterium]|nr:N-methyl-L-tryptophan oxidase [Methylomirabilota bacterium]